MTIILSNIRVLYDGTSAKADALHRGVDVRIDKGKIVAVSPHSPEPHGDALRRIDCSSYYVGPGLIDCHGHVTSLGVSNEAARLAESPDGPFYVEKVLYTTLVDGGVTTMRDVGGAPQYLKRLVDAGRLIGPRLRVAICMLSTTGGHADFRGPDRCHDTISKLWPAAPGRPSSIVDGPWECRKRVREIIACGADLIKLCTSAGIASPSDRLSSRDFTPEEVAAICDEAGARGLRVAAHAHSREGIELAIRNGVHDIQHVSFLDERLMEEAKKRGCSVTPTAWVIHELTQATGLTPFVKEKVNLAADAHARAVEIARTGGLTILAGTDPVLPGMHGKNYMELVVLARGGLAPLEAWHSSTGLAATHIAVPQAGTVAAGQFADLVFCSKDVFEKPEELGRGAMVEVMKDGMAYRGTIPDLPVRRYRDTVHEALPVEPE
jgi:imidazolonepropionase-like amidohydrolase